MDEISTEAISTTDSVHDTMDEIQEIDGTLIHLEELMDSVRKEVKQECLETAISSLRVALNDETTSGRERLMVCHHFMKALLVRYGHYGWINDLDECVKQYAEGVGDEEVMEFLLVCQGGNESVINVQIATQLIEAFQSSINVATLDSIVCTATEALASYNTTYLGDKLRHQVTKLRILLGKALVMKYLNNGDIAALHQATLHFQQAEISCLENTALAYISLTALQQVELLQFIGHGNVNALVQFRNYMEKAGTADAEGANLLKVGIGLVEHAVDDAQLREGIALLTASMNCRMGDHPRRWASSNSLANAFWTSFTRGGDFGELESCIALHREALDLLWPPHPCHSKALNDLAISLSTRFDHKRAFEDLEECIALQRKALDLRRPPHPDRFASLNNLAVSLGTRFNRKGAFEDLEECIALEREALDLRQPPHPDRSSPLNNLAIYLSTRFNHKGAFEDLEECIALEQEALDLRRPPHPDRAKSLNNLASSFFTRFNHKRASEDLDKCIALGREALDLRRPPHPGHSMSLNNLTIALFTRFNHKEAFEDLDECIALKREALNLRQPPHPDRSKSLNDLAISLSIRFNHKGAFEDLEECIALQREALKLRQPPHPDRSSSLNNLAIYLSVRFNHKGAFEDLEECIALGREALDLRQPPHPGHSISLNNLAVSLKTRFKHKGAFEDLEECITLEREALNLQQPPHPDRYLSLNNLAISLATRFHHKGAFENLEECIALEREALDLRRPPHPDHSKSLNNLAASLFTRFNHKGAFEDLDECIALERKALGLLQPPHPDYSSPLHNLAIYVSTRFDHKRAFEDLQECIALEREALKLRQPPHPEHSKSLSNLARALFTRFNHKKVFEDLKECIALQREALKILCPPHPDRPMSLNNLAISLKTCLNHEGAFEDLEECIALEQEALDLQQPPNPYRSLSLNNLASSLETRFKQKGRLIDIENALKYFQEAAKYPTGSLIQRLQISERWATCAQDNHHLLALDAYKYSMELLPQLASLDLTLQQRQDVLQHSRHLVGNAAGYAINVDECELAAVFLSNGRSIFWSQALQLRTPVNELMITHQDIAARFITLSMQLENASHSQDVSTSGQIPIEEPGAGTGQYTSLHRLSNQHQQTIEDIRQLPEYKGFLLPPLFSALQSGAKNGPIIFLTASKYGCNVLIMHDTPPVKRIHLTGIDLVGLLALKHLVSGPLAPKQWAVKISPDVEDSLQKMLGRDILRDMVLEASDTGIARDEAIRLALECLWSGVVQPVLSALGTVKTDSPKRIWWCPTGLFASLPIHAAGIYSDANMPIDCLFQYAVSSYCTSPQDLLHPSPQITQSFKMTAVIEPEAPNAGDLPATLLELERIKERVPDQQHLITHLGSKKAPNQVEDVVSDIQQSSFVHFGCHGRQDFKDPLKSLLLLSGGKLTMSTLIKECRVPEGALAYLSACETAKGNEERPDESLNLVATMMSILDDDAPIVADEFYRHLFRNGKDKAPDVRDAAYGLHLATQKLRDLGRPLYSWVPYVHYGI